MPEDRPVAAFVVSLLAGVLITIDGLLEGVAANLAYALGSGLAGDLLGALAFFGVLFGLIVLAFAGGRFLKPENPTMYGIAIIVVSLL